ncbi:glycosyltransferase family 1 protein [Marinihelvus fidelis]|uniref:Glycosyltransferase family 1 protein n=1 Tax=Marinihelvus fidelis TaxID=2613842 RepID=A0A5N0TDK5_9GAMM|nr:nucleotide disphospho-sugar-binding domain-containing protein [Marinihelvus fidelis]KAA9133085.1 glycosyltransferase family 1 protein [Marinihelvus fidelis]
MGYELGGGHGHLHRLLPLARALQGRGHRVTLFLRNILENAALLAGEKLAVLPVPDLAAALPGHDASAPAASYLDIMGVGGFNHAQSLQTGLMVWNTLLEQTRPDLVIADHSPILMLACFGRYPVLQFADGFTLPPAHRVTFPRFRPGAAALVEPGHVLGVMQAAQRHFGLPQPQTVTEPFRTAGRLVCTLPELDPYATHRRDPVVGPVADLPEPVEPPPGPPRFFAYLDLAHRPAWSMIKALRGSPMGGEIYARGMTDQAARAIERPGLTVHRDFQPLTDVFARTHVVLHHGSNGTCCAALAAGRPQIIAPLQMEARLTADAVVARGCGHLLKSGGDTPQVLGQLLHAITGDGAMMNRARQIAELIARRGKYQPTEQALTLCDNILESGGAPLPAYG